MKVHLKTHHQMIAITDSAVEANEDFFSPPPLGKTARSAREEQNLTRKARSEPAPPTRRQTQGRKKGESDLFFLANKCSIENRRICFWL